MEVGSWKLEENAHSIASILLVMATSCLWHGIAACFKDKKWRFIAKNRLR
jgi:hypothetical protein